ncbi:hypothetical protein GCM10010289_49780 [Streptomyces violascens]|uniref:Uncharacterized protein n=1 Tax=Streptomyces violascens TaxID=67381 RepID=A0ABQ3QYJ7_9ACTN|nr:hypothetical protein GCM10010289_49780 [Streptomyces violascens]GHI42357.1 hypothetical protein Sviol_67650 [Streptomyces violascens]
MANLVRQQAIDVEVAYRGFCFQESDDGAAPDRFPTALRGGSLNLTMRLTDPSTCKRAGRVIERARKERRQWYVDADRISREQAALRLPPLS